MVLSSHPTNYEHDYDSRELGIREQVILTLGTVESISEVDLYILIQNFNAHVAVDSIRMSKNQYQDMISKLKRTDYIRFVYNPQFKSYTLSLTSRGMGELDALLFNRPNLSAKWNRFIEFANLVVY
ncbi:MAG: hypothetical protein INQ03_01930 [Candidatus Heimdallarchaeota archaeon]|nr:hypothetical protein [Candidatus Heimdallarchaeota archaeon]